MVKGRRDGGPEDGHVGVAGTEHVHDVVGYSACLRMQVVTGRESWGQLKNMKDALLLLGRWQSSC
jgi:hypothetical protein